MFAIGNNLNRGHIYFQDFWKCSSILNKAKQLQFNRKQKLSQKRRKKPTWALPGSAQPTGSASHPLPRARRQGRVLAARRPRVGHLLLLPTPGDAQRTPRDPHASLSSSLTLPLVSLILSRDGRARPSPPIAVVATIATPSPLRRAHQLRLDSLVLPTKPRFAGSPATPPSPSSSTSGIRDRRRPHLFSSPSPSPLTPSQTPL